MLVKRYEDWKDIVQREYDKCLAITILFTLFTFIVFPNVETRKIERNERVMETIEVPVDMQEKIKPPEQVAKPVVQIEIIDDASGSNADAGDVETVETIESTTLDPYQQVAPTTTNSDQEGKTSKFVMYEDPPVVVKQVDPEYPAFARKAKIQGAVILEVEVLSNGSVGAVEIKKSLMAGPGGLDEAAIRAVKQWRFSPAKSGGKPIACWVTFPCEFSLEH